MPMYPDKEFENMPILEAPELRKKKGISGGGGCQSILNDLKLVDALHIQNANQKRGGKQKEKENKTKLPNWEQAETNGLNFISKQ